MALLFIDGFDDYTTTANMAFWWGRISNFSGTILNQTGINGVNGLSAKFQGVANSAERSLATNYTTLVVGFRAQFQVLNQNFGAYFFDSTGNGPQIGLSVDAGGVIHVKRGAYNNNADIGTVSGFTAVIGQAYYFEMKVTFATGATGSVTIHINGGSTVGGWTQTFSSVQTAQTANAFANVLGVGASGSPGTYIDDLYLCDTTGTANNDFRGDCRVEARYPAAAGRVTQWGTQVGGTGGSPWTAVNEANPDGDTSYLADNTAGHEECFTISSGTSPATLYGVQVDAVMRKDDTSAHVLASGVGNGTTESYDTGTSCSTTYAVDTNCMDTNPLTSAAWAPADLSTLQVCVKTVS